MPGNERTAPDGKSRVRLPKSSGALALLALLIAASCGGCTLVHLREETRDFYAATVLAGRVLPSSWQGPVSVAAITRRDGQITVEHQVWLHEPGSYELIVSDGSYTVVAFGDRDNDGVPDSGAPTGTFGKPVHVERAGLITLLDIPLAASGAGPPPLELPASQRRNPLPSSQVGALARLDDARFSSESGRRGYWSPLESFRVSGGNVYFVEEYDPARIPVLFVHGAAGSAQDWRYFIEHLDRRYQAWIFQYPSGAPLDSMSHLLFWKIINLQMRYGFTRLHVVAHSMGGLVARRLLVDHGAQLPQIEQFISISTPWDGEVNASLGVAHSPAVVPSWRDLEPDGPFLKSLFSRSLPPAISHSLLFGHRGGYNLLRPTSDGTITLASQLRSEAQSGARFVMGFDEDHVSILAAPSVVSQAQRLLAAADGNGARAGGSLRFELRAPAGHDAFGGVPTAVLIPAAANDRDARRTPLLLAIATMSDTPEVGPLEAGEYDVYLAIGAFRSSPKRQRIRIDEGGHSVVAFDLKPEGFLLGQVVAKTDSVARPAGSKPRRADALEVDVIQLAGPSGQRALVPRHEPDATLLSAYLDRRDDAVGGMFNFLGLTAGEHVLTIKARGYEDHVSSHWIEPGKMLPLAPIVMHRTGSEKAR